MNIREVECCSETQPAAHIQEAKLTPCIINNVFSVRRYLGVIRMMLIGSECCTVEVVVYEIMSRRQNLY